MISETAFIIKEMQEVAEERTKLKIARNLLDILDDETIALKTELNIDEVKEIRKEHLK